MKRIFALILIAIQIAGSAWAQESLLNKTDAPLQVNLEYEKGAVAILYHTLQFGTAGTVFDYRTNGGQELLFPFERFQIGLKFFKQHKIDFLYQPLEINTSAIFKDDVTIDEVLFPAGTAVDMKYGFPFYRLTYNFDFFSADKLDLGAGVALQIRNASIIFTSADGTHRTVNQNLGPVPAVNLYYRQVFNPGFCLALDITGLYASSALINGATFDFEGSILDASLRLGYELLNQEEIFLNLRFLGGSAMGVSSYPKIYWTQGIENFTANYLATMSLTLGLTLK